MVRKISIALAAIAAVIATAPLTASAMGMHTGFHAGFHPGFHPGFAVARPFGFHEHGFAFRHHPFFRDRFAVFGLGYPYPSYDSCYSRVLTAWGWRWTYVCY
jgi:hypothetical protein